MDEDYKVPAKSDEEVESIARGWRKALLEGADLLTDVLAMLAKAALEFKDTQGLEIIVKPDEEMGTKEAYAVSVFDSRRIFVRQSTYEGAKQRNPRDVTTFIHELSHIILHPNAAPKARLATQNETPPYIPPYESAEHQARVFTAEFQMPRKKVQTLTSAEQIRSQFNVSKQAAEIRFKEIVEKSQPREAPTFIKSYLAERLPIAPKMPVRSHSYVPPRSKSPIDKIWEMAPEAPDHDPSEYRLSRRGFLVKRSDYLKMSPMGWSVAGRQICAFLETDAAASMDS